MKVRIFAKDENMRFFYTTANLSYDQKCWHFTDHTKLHLQLYRALNKYYNFQVADYQYSHTELYRSL